MRRALLLSAILAVGVPHVSFASVFITEIAWMGKDGDANAEWIELYNDAGTSVDFSGWTLKAVDGQPDIALSGILAGGSFALLERSSDETVSGVSAFLIYTGSLGNTGELLELRNAEGVIEDSVDGRDGWSIGGNNDTKETLQRTGAPPFGAWTTGAPSPESSAVLQKETSTERSTSSGSFGGNIIYAQEREEELRQDPALTLDIGGDRTVSVGAPTSFLARAYRESGKEVVVENVTWNFGDGATSRGREVEHTYWYPGEYVVSVTGHREGFLEDIQDTKMITVHVVEPPVVITDVTNTYVTLNNKSKEVFDVSGFVLVSGDKHFRIPDDTLLSSGAYVRFSKKVTKFVSGDKVDLFDPNGTLVSSYGKAVLPQVRGVQTVNTNYVPVQKNVVTSSDSKEVTNKEAGPVGPLEPIVVANAYDGAISESEEGVPSWWWIFGLVTAIVTAIIAVILVRREQQEIIEGFYIESDDESR